MTGHWEMMGLEMPERTLGSSLPIFREERCQFYWQRFSNIRIMVNEFLDNLYFRLVIIKETKKTSEGIT